MINCIHNKSESVYTITYFEVEIGWINPISPPNNKTNKWRALTRHGDVRHFMTFEGAKKFIVENHH